MMCSFILNHVNVLCFVMLQQEPQGETERACFNYTGLGEVLTFNISKINRNPIFTLGWVIGIDPKTQFCQVPSPLLLIFFFKMSFAIYFTGKLEKRPDTPMTKITIIRGTELYKIQCENGALIHHRNVDG